MPVFTSSQKAEIESAVFEGNLKLVSKLLNANTRSEKCSLDHRIYAAYCYRRLGLFKKALTVLKVEFRPTTWERLSDSELKSQMQAIQLLAFLGAKNLAKDLAERIPPTREDLVLASIAMTYYNCEEYLKAKHFWGKIKAKRSEDFPSQIYSAPLMSMCGGYSGNWQLTATELARFKKTHPENRFFHRFLMSNTIIAKVLSTQAASAVKLGKKYLDSVKPGDPVAQVGITQMYYGGAIVRLQKFSDAKKELDEAFKNLYRPGEYAQIWSGVLYWRGLATYQQTGVFPEDWKRLLAYPNGVHSHFLKLLNSHEVSPKSFLVTVHELQRAKTSSHLHYDLESETIIRGHGTHHCTYEVGFKLLDRAIIALVSAGEYGISEYALFDYLWKKDHSIYQCRRRITQVVDRMRKLKLPVSWEAGQIKLEKSADISVQWSAQKRPRGSVFLDMHPHFSRQEVEKFFSISKSQALQMCTSWLNEKQISRTREKTEFRYFRAE